MDPYANYVSDNAIKQKLAQTTLLLETLAQVNSLMGKGGDFESFCTAVSRILQTKLNFKYIHIWLADEKNTNILRLVTPEYPGDFRALPIEKGLVGKTFRTKRTTCVPDVRQDSDYLNIHPETISELCVPLITDDKQIGVINIETDSYQTFSEQIPILEIIAENLSNSLKIAMLHKREEMFHKLVEHMHEGVWVGDTQEHALYTNPALQKMIGSSAEELLKTKSYDLIADNENMHILQKEVTLRRQGITSEYELRLKSMNGDTVPTLVQAVPFGNSGSLATFTDLRQIKKAESRLFKAENYLAAITQYCNEAIIGLNVDGVIQSWNTGAEQIFGYKEEEMTGKSIKTLIPHKKIETKEFEQIVQETTMKGFLRNFETKRIHKNGKELDVSLTFSAIKDEKGKLIGLSAIYRDISVQKKWERELQDRFVKMQDAYKEMGKQRRYLDYIIDLISMTTENGNNKKQIATFLVNAMAIITKVDAVTMRLLDQSTQKLMLIAHSGLNEDWWSKKYISYIGSLVESAVKQRQPLKILDVLSDPRYDSPSLARKNNLKSALVIPLRVREEIIGSITLYVSHESNLSIVDDEFITVFSKQAAIAMKLAS